MSCLPGKFCPKKSNKYDWVQKKFQYLNKTTLEEKRKQYVCKENFKTIDDVKRWGPGCQFAPEGEKLQQLRKLYDLPEPQPKESLESQESQGSSDQESWKSLFSFEYPVDPDLNIKLGIFLGTIDTLEVDAVVVPCNQYFQSSKEFTQAIPPPSSNTFNTDIIHEAAGPFLRKECNHLQICSIGNAAITGGYRLPAKYVIFTAAPTKDLPEDVEVCYFNSLSLAIPNEVRTIAFPCISSGGMYGIHPQKAAERVLIAMREFLDEHDKYFDLVVFCLKDDSDIISYQDFLPRIFPFK